MLHILKLVEYRGFMILSKLYVSCRTNYVIVASLLVFSLMLLLLFNAALLYKLWSLEAHTTIQLLSKQQYYHSHAVPYHSRVVR